MSTCKHCKHWRRGGQYARVDLIGAQDVVMVVEKSEAYRPHAIAVVTDDEKKTGLCLHPANFGEYASEWRGLPPDTPERFDGVRDEGERSFISFGEDFGCIHFEPK